MLPNMLIVGAMKAGTSSLHRYIGRHPRAFMSEPKELNFFAAEPLWRQGPQWYARHFEAAGDAAVLGESSPAYAMHPFFPGVPGRVASLIPHARIIYLVRHPIERIRSQYLATFYYHRTTPRWEGDPVTREHRPIAEAVLRSPAFYVDLSRYAMQVEQYLEHFPREQVLVLKTEELKERREATMRRVFDFLGLEGEPEDLDVGDEFNQTARKKVRRPLARAAARVPGYSALAQLVPASLRRELKDRLGSRPIDVERARVPETLRRELEDMLRDDIRRLRAYLGDDFDGWGIA